MAKLLELAKTIRSKNAGVDHITFDIIFTNQENYQRVKDSGVISRETIAALYRLDQARITDLVNYDPGRAIKFTIRRARPSGAPGERDVLGAQQYAPPVRHRGALNRARGKRRGPGGKTGQDRGDHRSPHHRGHPQPGQHRPPL